MGASIYRMAVRLACGGLFCQGLTLLGDILVCFCSLAGATNLLLFQILDFLAVN